MRYGLAMDDEVGVAEFAAASRGGTTSRLRMPAHAHPHPDHLQLQPHTQPPQPPQRRQQQQQSLAALGLDPSLGRRADPAAVCDLPALAAGVVWDGGGGGARIGHGPGGRADATGVVDLPPLPPDAEA